MKSNYNVNLLCWFVLFVTGCSTRPSPTDVNAEKIEIEQLIKDSGIEFPADATVMSCNFSLAPKYQRIIAFSTLPFPSRSFPQQTFTAMEEDGVCELLKIDLEAFKILDVKPRSTALRKWNNKSGRWLDHRMQTADGYYIRLEKTTE